MNSHTLLILIPFIFSLISNCLGNRPTDLGVNNGKLVECPDSPNCVLTQSNSSLHKIDPIIYKGSKEDAVKKIISIINSLERTKIVTKTDDYIHAEFTSKMMRFVDDVEFYFDDKNKLIHFRSASRIGFSDFDVNRNRMENIKELFSKE